MSRSLSPEALKAIYAPETDEVFLVLLTIVHETLEVPIRVTSDGVDTNSRGAVFTAFPFELTLPDEQENRSPRARLVIDNVSRDILAAIKGMDVSAVLKIEIVRAASPDTVEAVFPDFRLTNVRYNAMTIEGELTIEDFTAEPYPAVSFTPALFPGMF